MEESGDFRPGSYLFSKRRATKGGGSNTMPPQPRGISHEQDSSNVGRIHTNRRPGAGGGDLHSEDIEPDAGARRRRLGAVHRLPAATRVLPESELLHLPPASADPIVIIPAACQGLYSGLLTAQSAG